MDKLDHETKQELKKIYARVKALTLDAVNLFQAGGHKAGGGIEQVNIED